MYKELNNLILNQATKLDFIVKTDAPSLINEVKGHKQLVIWSGASDCTIWNDPKVNYAFRALHDALHIESGLGFSINEEIELGRIQANKYTGILADLVYLEVAGQAKEFLKTGQFITDQV